MKRLASVILALVLFGGFLGAQQPTFRSSTRLIVETVTVTNPAGQAIEGLTAGDFLLTEDNVPQSIAFLEFQRVDRTVTPGPLAPPRGSTPGATPDPATIAVSRPGELRYRDRRLLVFYFDVSGMPPGDLARAYGNALKYIDTRMAPLDAVAVMTFQGGGIRVKQDFTDSKPALKDAITRLIYNDDLDGDGIPDSALEGTAFGQNDSEFNIFNTDRQLAALQTAVDLLRSLAERKTLIYFSSGLRLNGADNQAQLRATVNAAVRANVTINPIDARGLVASAPLGDATQRSPSGIGIFTGQLAAQTMGTFQRSQDTLFALAKDTGGQAMFDYNDLSAGIAQAADAVQSYYILGYYSSHPADDGKFRRVKVTLRAGLAGSMSHRQGYFADKAFAKMSGADKERQLEDALMLANPITDIPMALEINYFQLNRAEYFVPVSVKIPGSELALAKRRGAAKTVIDFIGEVKDSYGTTIQNFRDHYDISLTSDTAAQWTARPIHFETGFTLLPDQYVIKLLARDAVTGRIGTYQAAFTVPNLNKEGTRVPISTVVLSAQREASSGAIATVKQKIDSTIGNPLMFEGQKLIPSVTRVFSKSRELYVLLEAYQRDVTEMRRLVAFVSFYRDDVKVMETSPLPVTEGWDPRSKAVPMRFSIPLQDMHTGRYDCQVTVLDTQANKVAFWRAPIVVVP